MKRYVALFFVTILTLMIISCGPSRNKEVTKITGMEGELFSADTKGVEKAKAAELTDAYIKFAEAFPDDTLSADYLFRAADLSMNILEPGKAIELYDRITDRYPSYRKAPQCIFLKAFVYENNLNNLDSARKYYEEFLEKYPEDDFADDAGVSLQNLGKTPEELIREFEERLKAEEHPAE